MYKGENRGRKMLILVFMWAFLTGVMIPDVLGLLPPVLGCFLSFLLIVPITLITMWIILNF